MAFKTRAQFMNHGNNRTSGGAKRKALSLSAGILVGIAAGVIGGDLLRTGQVDWWRLLSYLLGAAIGAGIMSLLLIRRDANRA
jgi:hypothetical protein